MTGSELRSTFLRFFKERGHTIIPSASLVPENDPSVLFTTAGMHPLVPYLLGEPHPGGTRLADVQKCIRTGDIDEVGDNRHLTFFEMLGNWSLGDYFKEDAIRWSWEFLTGKDWLAIPPEKLAVTVFAGDGDASKDDESVQIWKSLGVPEKRIAFLGKDDNWWPAGGKHPGPQGPDTEMFYWTGEGAAPELFDPKDERWVEIWNDVFMQFAKTTEGDLVPLVKKNVDTGMGLERTVAVLSGQKTVFETDLFQPLFRVLEPLSGKTYGENDETTRLFRIIADHIKAATMILGDDRGVVPSNVDQGYVLRRLIRRAVRFGRQLGIAGEFCTAVAEEAIRMYAEAYPELERNRTRITAELAKEEQKFATSLVHGMREFEKLFAAHAALTGEDAFVLYTTYGFPLELTEELARERGQKVDRAAFTAEFEKHQELSRAGSEQKFVGGLADHSVETTRLHTATHLLHRALKNVLGDHVQQKGSNITRERLRFDFTHAKKMTVEEVAEVERQVNQAIADDLPMHYVEMTVEEAKASGALGYFEDKYAQLGGNIKVYMVGDEARGYFSKEICGGPHVTHTGDLGSFRILKEEAVAAGIRRIKATVTGPK